jgi:mitochondrial ornithine carrier protein
MAENATLFFAYNRAQEFFKSSHLFTSSSNPDTLSITGLVAAGGISGACTSYVLTPIELVKCKLQVQNVGQYTPGTTTFTTSPSPASSILNRVPLPATTASLHTSTKIAHPGPLQLALQIYRAQGISGFWRGQMGTFLRETGGSAAWFGTYEYVSSFLKSRHRQSTTTIPAQDLMFSGACAGMAYNLVLFPADSIKSRMQTDAISDVRGKRGKGFWEVGKEMWKYGGIRVFYRGCLITVLRAAPSSAVIFWTYENLKKIAP